MEILVLFRERFSGWWFDCLTGLSRSYSTGCSSSTLSDLDDIASLPDLFDLPLTPEEASEYCSLDLLGGGASAGNTSHSSSSSSSSSSSPLSNQNSPQQTILDGPDASGLQLLHVHSQTFPLGHLHTVLDNLPDDCSITDLGKCKELLRTHRFTVSFFFFNYYHGWHCVIATVKTLTYSDWVSGGAVQQGITGAEVLPVGDNKDYCLQCHIGEKH